MAKRAGTPAERAMPIARAWKSVQFPPPGVAGEQGIAAPPARPALVVPHDRGDLVVDRPGLRRISRPSRRRLLGQLPDWSAQRDQRLGTEVEHPFLVGERSQSASV